MATGKRHYVYLLTTGDRRLKVGHTWNMRVRLPQLRRQVGGEVTLLGYVACRSETLAFGLEQEIHGRWREPGVRGEWYPWRPEIVRNFLERKGAVVCL